MFPEGFKVTDATTFADCVVHAMNDENEEGTTLVHCMLDEAINAAIDDGSEGIESEEDGEGAADAG